ncbi:penicillin-binding transpeptidase domain-containing protein [Gordonia desulfuricans]|uniref:Penicillin-binding transpeptidase domain-containing protein n=1 Tax=Gordonia desulfuricans TaxID=89051 RepID=A0A7K3LS87_9ACTN|nr:MULTISPECIES: penicillin-binding transpeptidase domain-containing protein [Gordonia]EMP10543.2 penicillin-binding protein [Gordonia sp. NB41Y]NDK90976.1 penicillin-binding transpeptidase domain-containing protein [Gordonia desulfuricans]WLP91179.1 penicillin-binding transpeptidase domain-containing protein [Gordonia sp. NB41Y]
MEQRRPRLAALAAVLISAALTLGLVTACSETDNGPRDAVDAFLTAFGTGDFDAAAALTDNPSAAGAGLRSAWDGLAATGVSGRSGRTTIDQDTAEVAVTYRWDLPRSRNWEYGATVKAIRSDADGWRVRWSSTDINPKLGADQRLSLRITEPPRAQVNESDGSAVMVDGTVIGIAFDAEAAAAAGSVIDSLNRLVTVLGPIQPDLDVQRIAEESTASDGTYPITRLSEAEFDRLRDQLAIPGVVHNEQVELVTKNPNFAPALLSGVKQVVESEVDGRVGWKVVTVNPNGLDADVLVDNAAEPAPAITLSLSRSVQNAAQRAVNATNAFQIAMVVIQPSTGKILAVAQNPAADRQGPIATTGLYPPGSTFKMVTSAAAFNRDMATPDTIVGCPGEITIGPRTIPNYDNFSLGAVTLQRAFAQSCNTTFAKLASEMGPSDLAHAATAMGLGQTYDIPGLTTATGSVPIESDLVARTEDGFGQGKDLASPFGMALVAATVANNGKLPVPQLILGRETKIEGPTTTLEPNVVGELRPMMREVVTTGTATRIAGQGEVYGKTGEAEFDGGSHAWFAGYRGDLAFATLVVRGGSSDNAVGVTNDFLNFLPAGF